MQPLRFTPILKQARWGGRRLATHLGKALGHGSNYAESWELADHGADSSVVEQGPLAGATLGQLVRQQTLALLGRHAPIERFPLLLKFLDACDRLSVQVHPTDEQALKYGALARGKTEAWVIIDALPGSGIYAGLRRGVDRAQLEAAIREGQVELCLHRLSVAPGDCFFIPSGTLHAIGEGVLLAEVQQSSDLTFRLFDWNRLGEDGQPRPQHVAEALACTNFELGPLFPVVPQPMASGPPLKELLVECPYFVMCRYTGGGQARLADDRRCRAVMQLAGSARLEAAGCDLELTAGQTVLVPASALPASLLLAEGAVSLEVYWS